MIATIQNLVLEAADVLKSRKLTLATAESCTGGGLSYWLTSVPGSSGWFERGFVTYSNTAKMDMLGVSQTILAQYGAVSEMTALAMANGIRQHSPADLGIAITGIAGPDGGSVDKPVGLVWLGFSGKQFETTAQSHIFTGDRQSVRLASIAMGLRELLRLVKLCE